MNFKSFGAFFSSKTNIAAIGNLLVTVGGVMHGDISPVGAGMSILGSFGLIGVRDALEGVLTVVTSPMVVNMIGQNIPKQDTPAPVVEIAPDPADVAAAQATPAAPEANTTEAPKAQ